MKIPSPPLVGRGLDEAPTGLNKGPAGFLLRWRRFGAGAFLEKTTQRVVDAGFQYHPVGVGKAFGGWGLVAAAL